MTLLLKSALIFGHQSGRSRSILGVLLGLISLTCFLTIQIQAAPTEFRYEPLDGESVQSISVRGSFNDWGEASLTEEADGSWAVTLNLAPGTHHYKYFINGNWPSDMATVRGGAPADAGATGYVDDGFGGQNAERVIGEQSTPVVPSFEIAPAPPLDSDHARVHYFRPDGLYPGWGVHAWLDAAEETAWAEPLAPLGRTPWGVYWDVPLRENAQQLGFLIHKGDNKDPGPDQFLALGDGIHEVWIVSGRDNLYKEAPDVSNFPVGDLSQQQAYWVDRRTILWKSGTAGRSLTLHVSNSAELDLASGGMQGGSSFELTAGEIHSSVEARFPHLAGLPAWQIADSELSHVPEWLRGQVAISARDESGSIVDATGLQIPGVLDDLFTYAGPLGPIWDSGSPSLYLWAPTARNVQVLLYEDSESIQPSEIVPMRRGKESDEPGASGVWRVDGRPDWKGTFYLFEVEVFVPDTGRIEVELVTDPYSRSLSTNSQRSQIIDLDDPALMPPGWLQITKASIESFTDLVLYELHVRDFSALDAETPPDQRGTYLAFTLDAPPTRHLRRLRAAGVTHIHLLPVFDIATVDEDRSTWPELPDLSGYAPDSDQQQAQLDGLRRVDGFNWGYDPFHFGVPEGSYSTNPDGAIRILEFRRMVQALSEMDLRVVMDVVYNHTHGSGHEDRYSVFDRIVPGYFHRLDESGNVHTSTCCQNTASEHAMFDRFVGDDLEHWARDFKIDGFRFDLMGHHMTRNVEAWRDRLRALSLDEDGVDGSDIYLYGEGWDFGEVQGGARGRNATQTQLAGSGIGTFNDRIRDAVRGGNPFGDRREQGFATGLFVAPAFNGAGEAERTRLLEIQDKVRIGLAGNLAEFRFTGREGKETTGAAVSGTGYADQPFESIQYVSAHDNETLFDKVHYAVPESTTLPERIRISALALSTIALAQGVPFFHAGSEILRSKSFDADSYDSGDWFNRLDFTYLENAFGQGLPPAGKNRDRWDVIRPLLSRADLKPGRVEIEGALRQFETFLSIRRESPLFRLRDAEEIQARVRFHNTGPGQIPGIIAMSLSGDVNGSRSDGTPFVALDDRYRRIFVLFNSSPTTQIFRHPGLVGKTFELHPLQAEGADEIVRASAFEAADGSVSVPGRTTAVFVEPR